MQKLVDFTRVPQAPPAVTGVFKDRDHLVPVLDLAYFLGINKEPSLHKNVIVTEFFGMRTGFAIDRVDWIHHFRWEDVIDAKTALAGVKYKYVIGIVKPTEDRMVQLLDYETILLDLCPKLKDMSIQSYQGEANFEGRRVLIAEDSPAVRAMLVNELSEYGFEVVETTDGEEAWQAYQKQSFDLVVSDVEMPRMDGLAFTLRVRQSERPNTPVIVYSSIGDVGMKARAAFLKADAHITKLNLNQLMITADKLIRGEKVEFEGFTPETMPNLLEAATV